MVLIRQHHQSARSATHLNNNTKAVLIALTSFILGIHIGRKEWQVQRVSDKCKGQHMKSELYHEKDKDAGNVGFAFDLHEVQAASRDLLGVTVDLSYNLNVPPNWWADVNTDPSYDDFMTSLHGNDVWNDKLTPFLDFVGIVGNATDIYGEVL